MQRHLRHLTALVALLALLATGCAADVAPTASPPTSEPTAADSAAPGGHEADDHAGHDTEDHAAGGSERLKRRTTEETIEYMRSMDPERLAQSHAHHDLEERDHPKGIRPTRIVIRAIDVDADVIELGLEPNGEMEVPSDFSQTGWFGPGVPPGRVGPAVIAGHVDSRSGPAVFFRLRDLEPGDRIEVHGTEGDVVSFEVRETEQHDKDDFPTEKVYAGTPGPELRLITCSGEFDRGQRSYADNLIVYAERVDA